MTNILEKKCVQRCYHCGRSLYIDHREHIGCLNSKCRGYLSGAKRIRKRKLKTIHALNNCEKCIIMSKNVVQ